MKKTTLIHLRKRFQFSAQAPQSILTIKKRFNAMNKPVRSLMLISSLLGICAFGASNIASAACIPLPGTLDSDGMPFCPDEVKNNSAAAVFTCAREQTTVWHAPTAREKTNLAGIISAFKISVDEGISVSTTADILANADALNLQACRVKNDRTYLGQTEHDSYLLLYTKPGVKTYSGPFLLLREVNPSKLIFISPHDGSDGTHASTKLALQNSHALAVVSNGHLKSMYDFVDHSDSMGAAAVRQLNLRFPKSVWLHIHGMASSGHVLYRSRDTLGRTFANAFEKGIVDCTGIPKGAFGSFNASYVTDAIIESPYSLKTEIPSGIHTNNPSSMGCLARSIENNAWAWPAADQ